MDVERPFHKIALIGSGNVAYSISKALKNKGIEISYIYVHNPDNLYSVERDLNIKATTSYQDLYFCDLIIIAVKDDAIQEVASNLREFDGLVVHTSGIKPVDILGNCARKGVFYPLQTMSKERTIDFSDTPILICSSSPEDLNILKTLASAISGKVYTCSDEQKKYIHLSAVFVSNFVNLMLNIGNEILEDNGLSVEIMESLIKETIEKTMKLGPGKALTGPAKRGDMTTISCHEALLRNYPAEKEIYKLLTNYILNKYRKQHE